MESTGRRTLASRLNCLCIWLNQMRSDRFHIGHVDPSTRRGVHLREATVRWRGNAAAARPVGVLQAIQTAAPSRRPDLFGPSPGHDCCRLRHFIGLGCPPWIPSFRPRTHGSRSEGSLLGLKGIIVGATYGTLGPAPRSKIRVSQPASGPPPARSPPSKTPASLSFTCGCQIDSRKAGTRAAWSGATSAGSIQTATTGSNRSAYHTDRATSGAAGNCCTSRRCSRRPASDRLVYDHRP